jgi:hypothetical protein
MLDNGVRLPAAPGARAAATGSSGPSGSAFILARSTHQDQQAGGKATRPPCLRLFAAEVVADYLPVANVSVTWSGARL